MLSKVATRLDGENGPCMAKGDLLRSKVCTSVKVNGDIKVLRVSIFVPGSDNPLISKFSSLQSQRKQQTATLNVSRLCCNRNLQQKKAAI